MHNLDVLFISPGNASEIYQDLAKDYASIETPTWALLLAESCRSIGHKVAILDINAERIKNSESIERIKAYNPKFICFVVYGQNVNAGTVSMSGAVKLSTDIKEAGISTPIGYYWFLCSSITKKNIA
jgi:anaerobic magnesium-protoporphyrin IX monomethyl ester cyclase